MHDVYDLYDLYFLYDLYDLDYLYDLYGPYDNLCPMCAGLRTSFLMLSSIKTTTTTIWLAPLGRLLQVDGANFLLGWKHVPGRVMLELTSGCDISFDPQRTLQFVEEPWQLMVHLLSVFYSAPAAVWSMKN